MMKMKKIAAMTAALLISASTMGYLPQDSIIISNVTANAAEEEITSVEINETNFPDAIFREYVKENFDTDGDGVLSAEEITAVTEIDVHNKGISDLTGIEYFENLECLDCSLNKLTTLDLNNNTALIVLYCELNQLTSLDVSSNTALLHLSCHSNQLTSLDISSNTALIDLECGENRLTSLDVSNNTTLEWLMCYDNQLTSLDVSNNTTLTRLFCYNNQLTSLDISENTALKILICDHNKLTSLDLSNNTALTELDCGKNQLTSLDVSNNTALTELFCWKNQLTSLDVSNNTALTELVCWGNQLTLLDVSNCSALTYLDCDVNQLTSLDVSNTKVQSTSAYQNKYEIHLTNKTFDLSTLPTGFDVSKASNWTNGTVDGNILTVEDITKEVTYKYDCGYDTYATFTLKPPFELPAGSVEINEANFPDENFRKFVKNYYDKDDDGVLSTEEIEPVTEMTLIDYIGHSKIEVSDLKGIEYFTNLELLDCHTQNLKELDLSRNTSLKALDCRENQLTTLDLSNNTALTSLKCDNNQLTELDLSNNTELLALFCNENQLTTLNVSKNTMLYRLECSKNQLTTIDTSNNTNLQKLMCDENQLTTIDISNNTLLDYLRCNQNQLKTIDISKNEELDFLKCNNNQLTSIDTHGRSLSLEIFDNAYEIALTDNTFDLSTLPEGFDVTKASNWTNAEVEGNILTVIDDTKYVTYDYDCEKGITLSFALFTKNNTDNQVPEKLDVVINQENFPDKAFRQYITERVDDDQNGRLSYSEAMGESTMHISESGISDLTGLQYFKNLYVLECSDNDLTQLDISENKALTHLNCENNNLTALDTSNNPFLYVLFCKQNNLTNLDVTNNTKLAALWCSGNQLTTLDVSKNTALKDLGCKNNQLTSLDLSNNKVLTGDEIVFDTSDNKYEISVIGNTFDLSTLPTGFDVSKTSEWTNGTVDGNILTVKDISKEVTYKYDCGHETIEIFTLIPTNESVTPPTQEIKVTLKGDANCDGKVTIADATAILQSLGNPDKYNLSAQGEKNADVTGNDGVMPSDAVMIQAYDAKIIDEF
ncbi:MAG: leucine-rich repeat domain-containing protein [Ruminococcus sp.]|nr:leucine-rich repeat domain-containing protein [Ruminococcus sp.]